ncbi:MAG: Squalene--hopene cyclase [Syntrophorhabdaceae bacterium PtaU1.Bin034]|nr:MAG: Squalene--hopene cyclase [Syntrophorhabdaceae bacterium PtaU1.Bin034]
MQTDREGTLKHSRSIKRLILPVLLNDLHLFSSETSEERSPEQQQDPAERVRRAIERTRHYYIRNQHPDGYWWFELESNVTITAEYLMLLHFAGLADTERDAKIVNHILKHQRPDGTWAIHKAGKGDLSTTVEAYFALKLGGLPADDPRLVRARRFIVGSGGVAACRFFTKVFLALFGQYDWKEIPSVPLEIVLLPHWFPLNIYNFSSWARATLVPLSIVLDAKPVKAIPENRGVRELHRRPGVGNIPRKSLGPLLSWKRFFVTLDKMIKATEESRLRSFRKKGLEAAWRWVRLHQEETGDWAGIQPAMVNGVLALLIEGHGPSDEPVARGLDALERFAIERENEILLQSCISPVWDTALTALALSASGLRKSHPAMTRSCRWLAEKQILTKGDWSVKRPHVEPGGWAFEFDNNWYPDVDDTAVVLMLLNSSDHDRFVRPENFEKAVGWVLGMQGKDGGWGAFDADNNVDILNQTPFGDLEAMIDPSTPDITGRVLELLGRIGHPFKSKQVKAAIRFLKKTQEKDGLWWGRWGVNYIYGTWSVLAGLGSIGEDMTKPYIQKAVATLKRHQNFDGGWGECCESYANPNLRMRGKSTPSQTAWVIMALIAAGEGACREAVSGIDFLLRRQKEDGTWDEEEFTATGFPKHFMIKYHNYRNCFPLMALGKFLAQFEKEGK